MRENKGIAGSFSVVIRNCLKKIFMKNEPVLTYNHMEEDISTSHHNGEMISHPFSLYLILAVDILLMGALIFVAFRTIF